MLAAVKVFAGESAEELALSLGFAVLFAFLGYRISARHRAHQGVTPWHLPSLVWALICLVFQPFGIIVELLAEFTTRPARTLLDLPVSDQTASIAPSGSLEELAPLPMLGPPPPRDASGSVGVFGWYADPTARHELRYFDGRRWSDHVADHGVIEHDLIDGLA